MDLRLAKAYLNKDRIADALALYEAHLAAGPTPEDEAMVRTWVENLTKILESKQETEKGTEGGEGAEEPDPSEPAPN